MSGEWAGWSDWETFKLAGIVEHNVDFSDEPMIVDHAVGRTKEAIGKCWAMDAAVAYTLMKAGPDKPLMWSEMLNTQTRSAAVMMSGIVGYGSVPDPRVKSCGHDEVDAVKFTLVAPQFTSLPSMHTSKEGGKRVYFQNGWGTSSMEEWITDNYSTESNPPHSLEECLALCEIRMDKGSKSEIILNDLVNDKMFKPLMAVIRHICIEKYDEDMYITEVDMYKNIVKVTQHTKGQCLWEDSDVKCSHHDTPRITEWALIRSEKEFVKVWEKEQQYAGFNRDMFRFTEVSPKSVVLWSEVRRESANAVSDDDVIKHIRDSLTRMLKRNDNIVSKTGRGHTSQHLWNDWGWLSDMTAYIKNTSSKNRKAGDVENGWTYTKINSRKSYGYEIAEFVWMPSDEIKDYIVGRKEHNANSWNSPQGIMNNLRFKTKDEVKSFIEKIVELHTEIGGHYASRTHDGVDKIEHGEWSVRSIDLDIQLHGRIDPIDYLSPQEAIMLFRNASPLVIAEHEDNYRRTPNFKATIDETTGLSE